MRRHPRAKRLQVILDLAEKEEDIRLKAWGQIQQKLQAEREQRQQLEAYNQEYQQKISSPGQGSFSAGTLHATLGFMQQIEQTLLKQNERLVLLERQADRARAQYLEQHGKVQALISLMDKLDLEQASLDEKQQQKQSDEWANRAASLRMTKE